MHTEHLQNVRPLWVVVGWLISAAATSLVYLALVGLGVVAADSGGGLWSAAAVAIGFVVGGFVLGYRLLQAPILYGMAVGLMTILVWFLLNLGAGFLARGGEWSSLSATATLALLVLQGSAAVVGARIGYRYAAGRRTDLAT